MHPVIIIKGVITSVTDLTVAVKQNGSIGRDILLFSFQVKITGRFD